jgi:hypothetical protein
MVEKGFRNTEQGFHRVRGRRPDVCKELENWSNEFSDQVYETSEILKTIGKAVGRSV